MGQFMSRTRVVMELRQGQSVSVNGGQFIVKVAEKTGRHSARLVFELDANTKVRKVIESPEDKVPQTP